MVKTGYKIFPRKEYAKHLIKNKNICIFCSKEDPLILKKYKHWTWMLAAFPYRKYHTLLVVKRHIISFTDLTPIELDELRKVLKQIELHYKKTNIVSGISKFGDQLFFSWRSRYNEAKKSVSHLHLHTYPKFGKEVNEIVGKNAHDIDLEKFTQAL